MQNRDALARQDGSWTRIAVLMMLLLLIVITPAFGQSKTHFFASVGPAIPAASAWGDGHRVGYSIEAGVARPISDVWDLVGAVGLDRFNLGEPDFQPLFGPVSSEAHWGPVKGGGDYVVSLRGGVRREFVTRTSLRPYLGALLGLSVAHQDAASADWVPGPMSRATSERQTLQDNNDQLGVGLSAAFGVSTPIGHGTLLFLETGYTFVFTPDDSFNDNPSFFPVRAGAIF